MSAIKYFVFVLFLNSCLTAEQGQNNISANDSISAKEIEGVMDFFVQNILLQAKLRDPAMLYPNFFHHLEDSDLFSILIGGDTLLNERDLKYMLNQYNKLSNVEIRPYLSSNYHNILSSDYDIGDPISFFEISPPMFSIDKRHVLIYTVMYFRSNNNKAVWDHSIFVLKKSDSTWLLEGLVREMKDGSVRYIRNKLNQ